ncbi:MAG: hypothetical protein EOS07_07450 [Mesorhizobium sp.]|nr:MAG: hypothetical protein EOS07_07450 [Mesorhizobium sp.]
MLDRRATPRNAASLIETFRREWHAEALRPQSTRFIPYPGLRSFNFDERPIFKARAGQIEALEKAVAQPRSNRSARHVVMVIGGSSSGKSSIVKAGLLAGIHSLELPGEPGNWYIAECRPVKSPMQEILQGLATMLIDTIVEESIGIGEARGAAADTNVRRIKEALESAVPGCPMPGTEPGSKEYAVAVERAKESLGQRIWGKPQRAQPSSMVRAFSAFVHVTLDEFDRRLFPERPGRPRLLLSIDQFEEIFRSDDVGAEEPALVKELRRQKEAVFELIRVADRADRGLGAHAGAMGDGDDCKFFVVTSMRSEDVHRCSQERELAEVFNRAVHLVQLVLRKDAAAAIVEPAQLTLLRFEFPYNGDTTHPYTGGAVEAILDAYEAASTTVEHRADALSLLQHFLRLLWQRHVGAWVEAQATELLIDDKALSSIPGWDDPSQDASGVPPSGDRADGEHKLARVLNARAKAVLDEAIAAWHLTAKDGAPGRSVDPRTEQQARSVLQAALVSIVRFDDNRRVVRDWKTVDEMLDASREAEDARKTAAAAECGEEAGDDFDRRFRQPLRAALSKFEHATLIERRADAGSAAGMGRVDKYAVYHESLIRNWAQYHEWVRAAGKAVTALRTIRDEIHAGQGATEAEGTSRPEEIVTTGREADLRVVIGSVDGLPENVAQAVTENERTESRDIDRAPWASQAWAVAEIRRAGIGKGADSIDLEAFQTIRREAIKARFELFTRAEREGKRAAQEAERAAVQAARAAEAEKLSEREGKRAAQEAERAAVQAARAAEAEKLAAEIAQQLAIAEKQTAEAETIAALNEKQVVELNRRKDQAKYRTNMIIGGLLAFVAIATSLIYYNAAINIEIEKLKYFSAKIGRIGFESSEYVGREPYQDRDAWLALKTLEVGTPSIVWSKTYDESEMQRIIAREKVMHRMRPALQDSTYSIVSSNDLGIEKGVKCSTKEDRTVEFDSLDDKSGPRKVVYHVQNGDLFYSADGGNPQRVRGAEKLETDAMFCASLDASALLIKSQHGAQPWVYLVLTHWNRWKKVNRDSWFLLAHPRSSSVEDSWTLLAYPRFTQTRASADLLGMYAIGNLSEESVKFVRDGAVAGFRAPLQKANGEKAGFLWTNEGFSAPTVDQDPSEPEWIEPVCTPQGGDKEKCTGSVKIDESRNLVATYYRSAEKDPINCTDESPNSIPSAEFCNFRFEIAVYNEKLRLQFQGRPPLFLSAREGWVIWKGDDDITRKIDLRLETVMALLDRRLKNIPGSDLAKCKDWPTNTSAHDLPGFYTERMPAALGGVDKVCEPSLK